MTRHSLRTIVIAPWRTLAVLGGAAFALAGCGGGSGTGTGTGTGTTAAATTSGVSTSSSALKVTTAGVSLEVGGYVSSVALGPPNQGVVTLFADGQAYYSPDGFNLGGGGATVLVSSAGTPISQIAAVNGGVEVLTASGQAYFSPDGQNLSGGGKTIKAYTGTGTVTGIVAAGSGINATVESGTKLVYSPDGLNLNGGGNTVVVMSSATGFKQVLPDASGNAAIVLYGNDAVGYASNASGPGVTANATGGTAPPVAPSVVVKLAKVGGGVIAETRQGADYLSADGQPVGPGAAAVPVAHWNVLPDANFGPRDSGKGAIFNNRLWLSGGFLGNAGTSTCGSPCSYFDLWASTDLTGSDFGTQAMYQTVQQPVAHNNSAPFATDFWDSYSPIVVWKGRLWALGSSTWSSADGRSWQSVKAADGTVALAPDWETATDDSRALVIGSYLYYIQSQTGVVLRTSDPSTGNWDYLGNIPNYTNRCGAAVYASQGTIFVAGGGSCDYTALYDDVFSSTDGIHWVQGKREGSWSNRMWPCVTPDDNGTLWLAGGYAPVYLNSTDGTVAPGYAVNFADVWYSKDGMNWKQYKADFGSGLADDKQFEPRHAPTCYAPTTAAGPLLVVVAGKAGATPDNNYASPSQGVATLALPSDPSVL